MPIAQLRFRERLIALDPSVDFDSVLLVVIEGGIQLVRFQPVEMASKGLAVVPAVTIDRDHFPHVEPRALNATARTGRPISHDDSGGWTKVSHAL